MFASVYGLLGLSTWLLLCEYLPNKVAPSISREMLGDVRKIYYKSYIFESTTSKVFGYTGFTYSKDSRTGVLTTRIIKNRLSQKSFGDGQLGR